MADGAVVDVGVGVIVDVEVRGINISVDVGSGVGVSSICSESFKIRPLSPTMRPVLPSSTEIEFGQKPSMLPATAHEVPS